jgi:hypothetical protein
MRPDTSLHKIQLGPLSFLLPFDNNIKRLEFVVEKPSIGEIIYLLLGYTCHTISQKAANDTTQWLLAI